ncbi:hypothetical protein O7632_02610 [Solwaraspora sp. WMMD406]|uniref:hypothetical protein n=1 Tax=Solwaraspora sp. WMMD406 TaxID=3016095 RepID=UPI002415DECB|nr:hypothetical protein [Solwaraspora sp. WMMD406]MDG4763009.1 hypothetical protein [Solwaraspora sp. WMMD406]
MAPVLRFLAPHFRIRPAAAASSAPISPLIEFEPYDAWERPADDGEPTLVREVTDPTRNVWGRRWRRDGRTLIHIPSSTTVLDLADDATHAVVYVSPRSKHHASDFLRDVAWELVAGDGSFTHAAAVSTDDGVIAIVGNKGAGKTTTAIEFMRSGADFFTGDVLFLAHNDNSCHSFPDYPHVGWGTLRINSELAAAARRHGLEPASDSTKVFLPHDIYQTALGVAQGRSPLPLRVVVAPQVAEPGAARIVECRSPDIVEPMSRETTRAGEGWESFVRLLRSGTAPAVSPVFQQAMWFRRPGRGHPPAGQVAAVLGRRYRRQ